MTNHFVKTKVSLNKQALDNCFAEFNERCCDSNLTYSYHYLTNDKNKPGLGSHNWTLSYIENNRRFLNRSCWFDGTKPRLFTISDKGGGWFAWWINAAILNEIAVRFDGIIYNNNDNSRKRGVEGRLDSFANYCKSFFSDIDPKQLRAVMNVNLELIPAFLHREIRYTF